MLPACTISHVLLVPIPLVLRVPCDDRVRDVGAALCTPRVLTPTPVHPTTHRCTHAAPLHMQSWDQGRVQGQGFGVPAGPCTVWGRDR